MNKQLPQYVALMLLVACFLVLNYVYGYVIDLQSETNDCFFMFGRGFALEFLDHPAAPLTYTGRFLGQFYHYRWLGALIVSGCVTCFGVLFHRVLVKLRDTAHVSMTLFPCMLLLALHMSTVCLVQDTLGICAGCSLFLVYLWLQGTSARRIYALLVTPLAYLALGVFVWIFVAWIVAFEWLDGPPRRGLLFKVAYVVLSMAMPLVAWRWVFLIPLKSAIIWPLVYVTPSRGGVLYCSVTNLVLDWLLALVFVVSLWLIPFWDRLSLGARISALWRTRRLRSNGVPSAIALFALAVLLCVVRYDAPLATLIAYRKLYRHKQWDALLDKAGQNPVESLEVQFMTNFALCQKGRLLDEMFHYPQLWGTRGLIFNIAGQTGVGPAEDDTYRMMYNSDLFYETGHVNLAFRHVNDSLQAMGETPIVLKRMAECSMANGNYEMADKYLRRLERTLFHRDFARRYRAIIADSEAADKEFHDIRRRAPVVDISHREHPVRHVALTMDNDNPVALNYMTAWFLLHKTKSSLATICNNVEHFKGAGYPSLPTHCQEVLLLWERQEGVSVDLRGFRYDPTITARVDAFLRDLALNQGPSAGSEKLRRRYGDTYMYYCFCVGTPEETRRLAPAGAGSTATVRQE